MVDIDKSVIARLSKGGNTFEILVDCDKALEFRSGKSVSINDIVATGDIFKDVKKGEKAPEHLFKPIFNTDDPREVAKIIIKEGEVQLTSKHREKLREEKRRKIIEIIHRNAIDSKTGLPHPPQRIESAIEEAKVKIDEHKSAEEQIEDILKKIRLIIPIRFETRQIAVKVSANHAGLGYGVLKRYKLIKDEWQNDGSLIAVVEIPAGIQEEFFNALNKATHGEIESKIVKTM